MKSVKSGKKKRSVKLEDTNSILVGGKGGPSMNVTLYALTKMELSNFKLTIETFFNTAEVFEWVRQQRSIVSLWLQRDIPCDLIHWNNNLKKLRVSVFSEPFSFLHKAFFPKLATFRWDAPVGRHLLKNVLDFVERHKNTLKKVRICLARNVTLSRTDACRAFDQLEKLHLIADAPNVSGLINLKELIVENNGLSTDAESKLLATSTKLLSFTFTGDTLKLDSPIYENIYLEHAVVGDRVKTAIPLRNKRRKRRETCETILAIGKRYKILVPDMVRYLAKMYFALFKPE